MITMSDFSNQINTQNKNVIIWLDFGPLAYLNFGIASALSKIENYNFIGIVSEKQDMSFFENQQIIPFQKLLYYPECYIGKSSFDLSDLKKFESNFDLNIWTEIFTERSFYKYWTQFYKFNHDEILTIVYHTISYFVHVLEKNKPELIIMKQVGDNIANLLFYKIAKKLGIKVLMINESYLKNNIIISDNLVSTEISDEFKKLKTNFKKSSKIYDIEFIKNYDLLDSISILLQETNFKKSFSQKISFYMKRLSIGTPSIYQNIGKTKFKMLQYRLKNYLEVKKRTKFLDNNSAKSIGNENFFYFPLASEPEARILARSPFFTNQIALAENIAKSIPINSILYVKEHPLQKIKFWRPITDYQALINIPNVKLIHPSIDHHKLLEKCQGVISISGGATFEAIFYKKPIILFSDENYDDLSIVTKVKTFQTLHDDIKDALNNFYFDNDELDAFMQAYDKHTLTIPFDNIRKDGETLSSIQWYTHDYNLTIKEFLKFYKHYEIYFELIAKKIYSKL